MRGMICRNFAGRRDLKKFAQRPDKFPVL